jgi:predicted Zn-dependent protease
METDDAAWLINFASDIEQTTVRSYGENVTLDEEIKLGDQLLTELKVKYSIYDYGEKYNRLNNILNKLAGKIISPRGFTYKIYLIESEELNAFTCGGKIFITTKIYNFCQNDSELAAIIGHEIAHNELRHINDNISRNKTANSFGSVGNMTALIGDVLITPFNQKNEVHCDFIGIDLMKMVGYSICSATQVWKRMSNVEQNNDEQNKLFSTHPYSQTRRQCCKNHIEINYQLDCD